MQRVEGGRVRGVERRCEPKLAEARDKAGQNAAHRIVRVGEHHEVQQIGARPYGGRQGVQIAHFNRGDRGALRIADDNDLVARGGLRHDCVVQNRDALLDGLTEALAAGKRPKLLRCLQTHQGVAGVVLGEIGLVDRRHVLQVRRRVPGAAHDQRDLVGRRLHGGRVLGLDIGVGVLRGEQRLHELVVKGFRLRAQRLILLGMRVQ